MTLTNFLTWMPLAASVLYFAAGIGNFMDGKPAFGIMWTCYAIANVAMFIASR